MIAKRIGKPKTTARPLPELSAQVAVELERINKHRGYRGVAVVIDPISAYLGSADSHKNAEIRALLAPLSEMASRLGVAVVGVSHLNKAGAGGALSRVTGSLAFVAAARATYIVSKDPGDPARRLFLPAKNNIGPDQTGLAFTVEGYDYDGIQTSRVMWEPDPVTMTADEAVVQHDPEERSEREDAKEFLQSELAAGPIAQKEIRKAASDAGHSWSTVRRAKSDLGIQSKKTGVNGGWEWKLPAAKVLTLEGRATNNQTLKPEGAQGAHTNNVGILGTLAVTGADAIRTRNDNAATFNATGSC